MIAHSQKPILEAVQLRKAFPAQKKGGELIEVIRDADLIVHHRESVSIRGQSGSGKTTLLNLLSGLQNPDTGEVRWNGSVLEQLTSTQIAKMRSSYLGFIFQAFYLVPELNALENVLLAQRISGEKIDRNAIDRARDLLVHVGLEHRMQHLMSQLSGGESQRVAICRALVNNPTLILADEPTGNLDERTGEEVMSMLLDLCAKREVGLVLVTHNPEFAKRTNRHYVLREGVLISN
jgi:lipoprotein-releasing system ATP-binding protein